MVSMATHCLCATCHMLKRKELGKQFGTIEMKVFADKLRLLDEFMNSF